jgi:hypothetical protein
VLIATVMVELEVKEEHDMRSATTLTSRGGGRGGLTGWEELVVEV